MLVARMARMADRFDEILLEMRTDRKETRADREQMRAEREEMRREREAWTARIDRRQYQSDENLRFFGELNRRSEIVLRDLLRSQAQMRAAIRDSTAQIRENTELTRAHTRAVWAVIDRLEGGGGLAPAS